MDLLKRKYSHLLPELPNAGLLWKSMGIGHYRWIYFEYPDDFYQEAALFLMSHQSVLNGTEEILLFCRAAYRYFYQVAIAYGWHKTGSGSFSQRERCFSSFASDVIECDIEITQTREMITTYSTILPPKNRGCCLNGGKQPDDEELITKLQNLAWELKRTPTQSDLRAAFHEGKCYSYTKYRRHFGSYKIACEKAGLTPNPESGGGRKPRSKKELVAKLQSLAKELGRTPSQNDIKTASREKRCYSFTTYNRHFGSYHAACMEAELEPAKKPGNAVIES